MILLKLIRKYKKATYTIGNLLVDGAFFCNTLEDKDRGLTQGMPLPVIMVLLFLTVSTLSMMSTSSFSMAMQDQGRSAGSASALIGFFSMISGAVMAPVVGIAGDHTAIPMGIVMVIGEIGALLTFYALIYPRHKDSL